MEESLRGVVANVLDCDFEVSEFEFPSCYNFHFRTRTLRKGMNPFIPRAMGLIVSSLFFYKDGFGIK